MHRTTVKKREKRKFLRFIKILLPTDAQGNCNSLVHQLVIKLWKY